MKFAVFGVNFGMPQKSSTKTHEIPAAHPLTGGGVLVAVGGPSPGRGEGKIKRLRALERASRVLRDEVQPAARLGRPQRSRMKSLISFAIGEN